MLKVYQRAQPPETRVPRRLTDEQAPIVGLDLGDRSGVVSRVIAGAGTGKTSTLEERAHRCRGVGRLCLVYNKSVQIEVSGRLPSDTRVMTGHGLAFASVGRFFANAGKLSDDVRWFELAELPELKAFAKNPAALEAVAATVQAFCVSANREISERHVPSSISDLQERRVVPPTGVLVDLARKVWGRMQRLQDPMPITHDGYLKIFQLMEPVLPYEDIWVDEAQDSNPVLLDIVRGQTANLLFVGDPCQAINGWRGAINAMEQLTPDHDFRLTQSFRFGAGVASIANAVLDWRNAGFQLRGLDSIPSTIGRVDRSSRHAVICRNNLTIVTSAIEAAAAGRTLGFVGEFESYPFRTLLDGFHLYSDNADAIADPYLKRVTSWGELKDTVAPGGNGGAALSRQWRNVVELVEKHRDQIPVLLEQVQQQVRPLAAADIIYSTGHRSKGLEFDQVVMGDDFQPLLDEDGDPCRTPLGDPIPEAEWNEALNLLYVTATRAKFRLEPNEALQQLVENPPKPKEAEESGRPRFRTTPAL